MTFPSDLDLTPAACEPTVARLQAVLDGDLPADALDADPHPAACPTCAERIRAARLMLAMLAEPAEPMPLPAGLTGAILAGVRADRRKRLRQRVGLAVGGLAAAAAVVVAVWWFGGSKPEDHTNDMVENRPAPPPAPDMPQQPPVRIDAELAKAGEGLRDSSRTITEPVTAGPMVFASLTTAFTKLPGNPVGADLEPAGRAIAEIPAAAKTGLEPVTGSAQKAFSRLLRDVGAVSPGKPKS